MKLTVKGGREWRVDENEGDGKEEKEGKQKKSWKRWMRLWKEGKRKESHVKKTKKK